MIEGSGLISCASAGTPISSGNTDVSSVMGSRGGLFPEDCYDVNLYVTGRGQGLLI